MEGLSSILVGVDFSPASAAAVRQAVRIAEWNRAQVHLVHVLDALVVKELEARLGAAGAATREDLARDARDAWRGIAANIPGAEKLLLAVEVDARVAGLIASAKRVSADLLVLGTQSEERPSVGPGTVATGCVRRAACDVLLVRDAQQGPFKSIVACVDFSETSMRALERAARIAAEDDAPLHVLHVYAPPINLFPFSNAVTRAMDEARTVAEAELRERLRTFCEVLGPGATYLRPHVHAAPSSSHGWGIVEWAGEQHADLVVLGTRGRTNLRDVLLGSTAERVLRESSCSILAVKPATVAGSAESEDPRPT